AFHQHRLECLNAEAVQRGSAVEQNRVILNHLFENVPNHRILLLHQFLGLLDGGAMAALLEAMIDKRLEQFQRHLLGKTALVEAQFRTHNDHRTARVVHALSEQVLAEAALLAFERIGERFQRTVVGAAQHAAATAVIEQRIDGFLQHALFVAHNHVRRVHLDELLQPVVAVDDAAIQVVQIAGSETAAIQRHQRTQFRRNHRDHVQNHPLRLVAALAEALYHAQALGVLQLLLDAGFRLHPLANVFAEMFDVHLLQQLFHALGAHHRDKLTRKFLVKLALALVGDDFALAERFYRAGIDNHVGFEIQHPLQFTERDVQQVAYAARQSFEEPHVRARAGQFDVAQPLAADTRQRHFHAALVADHAAMLHALILAAQALPILGGAENPGAEKAVALRLESPVIDSLRLGDFAVAPTPDFFRRCQRNAD